ncbi:protein kinase family protein [Streptomyces sp. NPDC005840]|uniref:protein kinase family protein n=1 Tax=Streptomyces sp. NPDC005840 TaxID=3157072 RepID=UPI0033F15BA4
MPRPTAPCDPARLSAHTRAGAALAALDDGRLADLVSEASPLGSGIGGRAAETEVAGVRVFVKRVPLTDLERRPEHVRSTANLFHLPPHYQYGVGSSGFGAWRELAAHLTTTAWVVDGAHDGFPLLHHWRVLPDTPPTGFVDFLGGIDGAVAHWEGSEAVRHRLEAVAGAAASLVLFLEFVPHTLADRLGADAVSCAWAERELLRGTDFLAARGFVHFDAHFANLLTDGHRLYFADLGLALDARFELAPAERDFHREHLVYDRGHTLTHLLRHHVLERVGGGPGLGPFLRAWLQGDRPDGVPADLAGILDRHARTVLVFDAFAHRLRTRDLRTPFPGTALGETLAARSPDGPALPGPGGPALPGPGGPALREPDGSALRRPSGSV